MPTELSTLCSSSHSKVGQSKTKKQQFQKADRTFARESDFGKLRKTALEERLKETLFTICFWRLARRKKYT
jgi:hypothetical protein